MMRKYAYGLRLLLALVLASGIFVTAALMQMEAKETQAYTTQDLNEQLVMAGCGCKPPQNSGLSAIRHSNWPG